MNKICVIINPAARGSKAQSYLGRIRTLTKEAVSLGKEVTIKETRCAGDAETQASLAVQEGFDIIVGAGGDGTLNEVVNGMRDSSAIFGLLPCGTINVFAQELGIPLSLEAAWNVLLNGKIRKIDLPQANGHLFVQMAGIGLDAQVVQRTDLEMRRRIGPISYLLTAGQIVSEQPPELRVWPDRAQEPLLGSFVLIGNGRYYGGPIPFFNQADIEDGLLDICIFQHLNYLALVRYFQGAVLQNLSNLPDVTYLKTARLRVECDQTVPYEVDGEWVGNAPVELSVQQYGLQVLVPG